MNTLLLTNYKHMALMHSRQPGCRPITKTTESTKKKKEKKKKKRKKLVMVHLARHVFRTNLLMIIKIF